MRAATWMTCLWPGLAALWLRGRLAGLVLAGMFAAALNIALVMTFWALPSSAGLPGWTLPTAAWVLVLSFWVLGIRWGLGELSRPQQAASPAAPQLEESFRQAQTEYLKGHWIEAETLLARLLARHPDDVEARLLLASIERRTRRPAAARKTLESMLQDETTARWTWEIRAELARLSNNEAEHQGSQSEAPAIAARAA
jgi:hypothetical protein